MAKNRIRTKRVSDLLHRRLATIIREDFTNPRLGMVTVSTVEVSPDLKNARIYVTVLEADKVTQSLEILNQASGFFKKQLADTLELRFIPHLRFVFDEHMVRVTRVLSLLEATQRGS